MQRRLIPGSWIFLFAAVAGSLFGQVPAKNESGISVGHVHLIVRNPDEHKKLWMDMLGAQVTHSGSSELLKIPGLLIVLEKGEPTAGSGGSSINHIGLWIKDYDDIKAKVTAAHLMINSDNYKAAECAAAPGTPACQMTISFPDGARIEFTEDKKLATTSAGHHIHMTVADPAAVQAWYAKTFGGTPYMRRGTIAAAMFESGEVDFNKGAEAQAPSKGRAVDHFGLEVKGLEAFCKKLEAQGVKFDTPYHVIPGTGVKSAFLTDPVGARIELTEGLAAK